ncbi:MAG: hypothetical protein M3Y59_02765 [Myxococcota bacterium]|nr:hypothetical protein [Myxococcota bacterium]
MSAEAISRRSLIKRGLVGGALLSLGGGGLLALRGGRRIPLPPEGLQTFDLVEYSVFDAFARRVVQPTAGPPVDRIALNADRVLTRASREVQGEVKQLLRLFENALAGFLFAGHLRPFTALEPAEQDAVIRDWAHSALSLRRTGYQALRTVALASYYGANEAWPATNYPGPPQGFWNKDAPVYRGGGDRREGLGVFVEEQPEVEGG